VTSAIASKVGISHRMRETTYWSTRFLRRPDQNEGCLTIWRSARRVKGRPQKLISGGVTVTVKVRCQSKKRSCARRSRRRGAAGPRAGSVESLHRLLDDARFNHRVETVGGVLASECGALLRGFFETKRS